MFPPSADEASANNPHSHFAPRLSQGAPIPAWPLGSASSAGSEAHSAIKLVQF